MKRENERTSEWKADKKRVGNREEREKKSDTIAISCHRGVTRSIPLVAPIRCAAFAAGDTRARLNKRGPINLIVNETGNRA